MCRCDRDIPKALRRKIALSCNLKLEAVVQAVDVDTIYQVPLDYHEQGPGLKIILAHMGGFTPWIRGRWQHGYEVREEPGARGAGPPEDYFDKFHYDTVIHNADCLEFAVKTIGADNILYGTDCPWDRADIGEVRGDEDRRFQLVGNFDGNDPPITATAAIENIIL